MGEGERESGGEGRGGEGSEGGGGEGRAARQVEEGAEKVGEGFEELAKAVVALEGEGEGEGEGESESGDEAKGEAEQVAEVIEGAAKLGKGISEGAAAVRQGQAAADALRRGDVGGGVGSIAGSLSGGATSTARALELAGQSEAAGAMRVAGAAANVVGRIARGVGDAVRRVEEGRARGSRRVSYEASFEGVEASFEVRSFRFTEALNECYELELELRTSDRDFDPRELLGKDCECLLDRREHVRRVVGVVRRVEERGTDPRQVGCRVWVVPALWSLGLTRSTRIFQNENVVQVITEVLEPGLAPFRREVDTTALQLDLYPAREYCVQYRESDLAFACRLMEEEGIGFRFDHAGGERHDGPEKLVLFDENRELPDVETMDGNPVPYDRDAREVRTAEPVTQLHPAVRMTPTGVRVHDHDWTRSASPNLAFERQSGADDRGAERVVYRHGHGEHLTLYDYDDGSHRYGSEDGERRAELRHQLEARDGRTVSGVSFVTGFAAGAKFELTGHPRPGADGRWLITRVVHASRPAPSVGGESGGGEEERDYHNRFECLPADVAWRPERRRPKPRIYGVQTARVVGPAGEEIHTDHHGRIAVQFHWDREGSFDERSSCWIRVGQAWSGASHPGFVFIPRVGMHVVVTFLDGDPDRPLVTGCVYDGAHPTAYPLPDDKTKSWIRTRSSPNSEGYNELRFEDKAGDEQIHLRAERDLDELVQHCHTTHVLADQTNTVDGNQTETVHENQTLEVDEDRTKTVHKNEKTEIGGNRTEEVTGHEQIHIHGFRKVKVEDDEKLVVHGSRKLRVDGRDDEEVVGGREVIVSEFDNLQVIAGANRNETVSGQMNVRVSNKYDLVQGGTEKLIMDRLETRLESGSEITLVSGSASQVIENGGNVAIDAATKVEVTVGGCKVEVTTSTITLTAGPTSLELGPSGATLSGPTVTSSAQTMNEITGLLVKIN